MLPRLLRIRDKHWEAEPTCSRAGGSSDGVCTGSAHGSQMSMQTALDLVLLLLDDIDAGQAISPESTQQLRAILLNRNGVTLYITKRLNMSTIVINPASPE